MSTSRQEGLAQPVPFLALALDDFLSLHRLHRHPRSLEALESLACRRGRCLINLTTSLLFAFSRLFLSAAARAPRRRVRVCPGRLSLSVLPLPPARPPRGPSSLAPLSKLLKGNESHQIQRLALALWVSVLYRESPASGSSASLELLKDRGDRVCGGIDASTLSP